MTSERFGVRVPEVGVIEPPAIRVGIAPSEGRIVIQMALDEDLDRILSFGLDIEQAGDLIKDLHDAIHTLIERTARQVASEDLLQ